MEEELVLATDPFEGDFGEPGDRTLYDKMATARKPGPCHDCAQEIKPGERIRRRADVFDGELMHFRWCQACCEAMELSYEDDGEAMEARIELGMRARGLLPDPPATPTESTPT